MELTTQQILDSTPALKDINSQKLPIKISFKIMTVVDKLDAIISEFISVKQNLINDHIQRDEEGKPIFVTDENGVVDKTQIKVDNANLLQDHLNSLLSCKNEIPIEKLNIDEFEAIKIEPENLKTILWLFSN